MEKEEEKKDEDENKEKDEEIKEKEDEKNENKLLGTDEMSGEKVSAVVSSEPKDMEADIEQEVTIDDELEDLEKLGFSFEKANKNLHKNSVKLEEKKKAEEESAVRSECRPKRARGRSLIERNPDFAHHSQLSKLLKPTPAKPDNWKQGSRLLSNTRQRRKSSSSAPLSPSKPSTAPTAPSKPVSLSSSTSASSHNPLQSPNIPAVKKSCRVVKVTAKAQESQASGVISPVPASTILCPVCRLPQPKATLKQHLVAVHEVNTTAAALTRTTVGLPPRKNNPVQTQTSNEHKVPETVKPELITSDIHPVKDPTPKPDCQENVEEPKAKPLNKVEEPKPPHKVMKPEPQGSVEEPKPQNKVDEPKKQVKVQELKPLEKVQEPKPQDKVQELKPQDKVEEPKPQDKVQDSKPQDKVEEPKSLDKDMDQDSVSGRTDSVSIPAQVVAELEDEFACSEGEEKQEKEEVSIAFYTNNHCPEEDPDLNLDKNGNNGTSSEAAATPISTITSLVQSSPRPQRRKRGLEERHPDFVLDLPKRRQAGPGRGREADLSDF